MSYIPLPPSSASSAGSFHSSILSDKPIFEKYSRDNINTYERERKGKMGERDYTHP